MTPAPLQTVAVTGAAGFVGGHLVRHLLGSAEAPNRIVALDLRAVETSSGAAFVRCDLTDADQVREAIADIVPDVVLHLAGVMHCDDLEACMAINVGACRNLLAAAAAMPRPPVVLVVGSAAQYGITSGEHEVVDESRPLLGRTPYGVSKTRQEEMAIRLTRETSVPVVCVRPFNLMGPGQPSRLVPAAFLHQVADVLDGKAREVCVGNTATRRDFLDVRDAVAAMWALVRAGEKAHGGVFNIASGEAVLIQEMLEACIALAGREIPVRCDRARLKPHDVPTIIGDAARLRAATGWRPSISWRRSLADMWADIRKGRRP